MAWLEDKIAEAEKNAEKSKDISLRTYYKGRADAFKEVAEKLDIARDDHDGR